MKRGLVVVLFALACSRTTEPPRTYQRPLLVSPLAYRIGGAPVRDRAIEAQLDALLAAQSAARTPADIEAVHQRARSLDATFERFGLAYDIDVQPGGVRVLTVENVAMISIGGTAQPVRELRGQPLDGTHTPARTPTVNLEALDRETIDTLLPMLAPAALYPATGAWAATPAGRGLLNTLAEQTRAELSRALGRDAERAKDIALLLRARDRVIADLPEGPRNAFPNPGLFSLDGVTDPGLPQAARTELKRLDRQLARHDAPRIVSRTTSLYAAVTGRHELQHARDFEHPLPAPTRLEALRPGDPLASTELSAYLSQIAADPVLTHFGLWTIAAYPLAPRISDRPEIEVAIVIVESLASQLGIPSQIETNGALDQARYLTVLQQVLARSNTELQQAAAKSFASLFGEAVP